MPTLATLLGDFLADRQRQLRPNSLRAYRADLRIAAAALPQPLDQITPQHIEAFLADPKVAPSSARRRGAALSRFFRWAVREEYVDQNPLDRVEPIPGERRLPRPVPAGDPRQDVAKAIALAPQPFRLIFTLLRETGMRIGEALGLNLGDVTIEPGREGLRIREAKNKVERVATLGPNSTPKSLRGLRAHTRALASLPLTTPLFSSNRGTRVSYAAAQYQWARCCTRAGLVEPDGSLRYTLHQLRHTRGTELIEAGQPLEIVQRVLGHRDIRSTQGYADLSERQVRAALEGA
ncbi:tyrosine-type recombinase/integrase [Oscillochloris sp. ZM17-4]|uniref:tyrosine-type recombinase/integrase n=1 Tax=Oscillochloris sp. ZM17-4 TaxID=2866714 RepID=UPI001C72AED7|nr:tyrosine-type recombinase/integrase [Oscillochloris sp. ZM17-4]MBX0328842.1 tyrosine-type recombinase/integrase [Oscillochloris sp. ZM17-4]